MFLRLLPGEILQEEDADMSWLVLFSFSDLHDGDAGSGFFLLLCRSLERLLFVLEGVVLELMEELYCSEVVVKAEKCMKFASFSWREKR